MEPERLKRIGKILLVSVSAYITSFFLVFCIGIFGGVAAVSSRSSPAHKYIVGPLPLFEGTPDPNNHETLAFPLHTGEEWPFVVYRPFVALYNAWQIPRVKKMDDEIEASNKNAFR